MPNEKNLLNESQVRQFMKLAKLEPLAPGFIDGLTEATDETVTEEEEMEESHGRGVGENPPHARGTGVVPEGVEDETTVDEGYGMEYRDDEAEMDMEPDMDPEPEMDAAPAEPEEVSDEKTLSVADVVSAITAALENLTGEPVEASIDGEDVEEEPMDDEELMDDEMALEEAEDADEVTTESAEEEVTTESETTTDELVEQITKKVAARILKSALAKK